MMKKMDLITYGFSVQGKSHRKKGTVCQDAHMVQRLQNGCCLLAAADGVGNAEFSDVGSSLAVEKLAEYCLRHVERTVSPEEQMRILEQGYAYVMDAVRQYSENNRGEIASYDTTLSAVLYDGKKVVFGHAGDGGIIVKTVRGSYRMLTERQKGADTISVRPLRAGRQSWSFGICQEEVAAVLIATDGILDGVLAPWLLNLPEDGDLVGNTDKNQIYVSAAEFFMNEYCVMKNSEIKDAEAFLNYFLSGELKEEDKEKFCGCLSRGYQKVLGKDKARAVIQTVGRNCIPVYFLQEVTDDKTVVCAINARVKVDPVAVEYYREPDWHSLKESYNAIFYPGCMEKKEAADKGEQGGALIQAGESNAVPENHTRKKRQGLKRQMKKKEMIHMVIDFLLCLTIVVLSLVLIKIY